MAQTKSYATKKKGKTEVYPFWEMGDIKKVIEWFENNNEWDGYLISMLELLLGRRIGDTVNMKWSDLYYENGNKKDEIDTIEEQKTGKITILPISNMVFEAIDNYCNHTGIKPMEHFDEFIFSFPAKTAWIERMDNDIYKENNLEKWCEWLNKDFSDKRKQSILNEFDKQKKYKTLGEYLYYEVEFSDVTKWQSDDYRKKFKKAVDANGITQRISTHTWRKSFGHWIYKTHPFDPDCILSLQKLFNHSDVQTTMDYIGLSTEKNRKYINDHGEFVKSLLEGNNEYVVKNSPVISLKAEDHGDILMQAINEARNTDKSLMEIYHDAINMANEKRVV